MVMKGIQFVKTDNQGIKLKVKKELKGEIIKPSFQALSSIIRNTVHSKLSKRATF